MHKKDSLFNEMLQKCCYYFPLLEKTLRSITENEERIEPVPMMKTISKSSLVVFGFLGVMIVGSVGLDQTTKRRAHETLMVWNDPNDISQYQGRRYPIWSTGELNANNEPEGFYLSFKFNYVRNEGAAWGALSGLADHIRIPFFHIITLVAVGIILGYLRSTPSHHTLARYALGLILSGAIGNFVDRIRYGYVIDWIDVDWHILGWRYFYPNFNIADACICVGVAFLLFDLMVLESKRAKQLVRA